MKFQLPVLAFLGAMCVSVAHAAQCTPEQLKGLESSSPTDEAAMKKACPSLANFTSELDFTNPGTLEMTQFMQSSSPCKDESCTTYLKEMLAKLPDCEYMGMNVKSLGDTTLKLCVDMANGKLDPNDALKEISGIMLNATIPGLGSLDGSLSDMIDQIVGNITDEDSNAAMQGKTTAPAPTKSSAGGFSTAAAALAVSVTLAAVSL